MQDNVQHVILTRFNIPTPGRESRVRSRPGWLEKRFELFEQFCLPTLVAQTSHNFSWLVYFDADTPAPFKARIEAYRRFDFFKPRFASFHDMAQLPHDIDRLRDDKAGWLLTTTLDNDDGLHREFVQQLQASVRPTERTVYNYERGLVYFRGRLYLRSDASSPFASFLEPFEQVRTIWAEQHIHLERLGPVCQLDAPPMWLQVIHDDNVTNRIRGERVSRDRALEGFAINEQAVLPETEWQLLLDRAVVRQVRSAREMGIKAYTLVRTAVRGDGPL